MKEIGYKLPEEFLAKLRKIYPGKFEKITDTFINKKTSTFRINYLKTDLVNLRKALVREKIKCKELSFPEGVFVLKTPLIELQKKEVYKEGHIYIQNISSMLPVICLSPEKGEKVLDLCAAPGSKTTQIASLAPEAEIVAIEKNRPRYYKLLNNLKIQGAESVKVILIDSIWVRKKFPEYFDKILADVPCSSEGRFWVNDPKSFKYWKQKKVKEMVHTQKKLLHSAFFSLKEKGILIYSTCTFSPEENEGVIDWFLNRFKEKVEILPLDIPLKNVEDGFVKWKDKKFSPDLKLTKRIIPNDVMTGFFIAKIRKVSF